MLTTKEKYSWKKKEPGHSKRKKLSAKWESSGQKKNARGKKRYRTRQKEVAHDKKEKGHEWKWIIVVI